MRTVLCGVIRRLLPYKHSLRPGKLRLPGGYRVWAVTGVAGATGTVTKLAGMETE